MRTSAEVRSELAGVEERLSDIERRHDEAESAASEAVKACALGESNFADLQAANLNASTLASLLQTLRDQQSALQGELETAQAGENRAATIEQMKTLSAEANAYYQEYLQQREQFAQAMRRHAEAIVDQADKISAARSEFIYLGALLADGLTRCELEQELNPSVAALVADLEAAGVDLTAVRAKWTPQAHSALDIQTTLPAVEFADLIGYCTQAIGKEHARPAVDEESHRV